MTPGEQHSRQEDCKGEGQVGSGVMCSRHAEGASVAEVG